MKIFERVEKDGRLAVVLATRKGGGGVLALDFDTRSERFVKAEVMRLIRVYKLGNCVVARSSSEGFHAIFFWNELRWGRIRSILALARGVDPLFKDFTKINGFVRIRLSGMPGGAEVVLSPFHKSNVFGDFNFRHYSAMVARLKGWKV